MLLHYLWWNVSITVLLEDRASVKVHTDVIICAMGVKRGHGYPRTDGYSDFENIEQLCKSSLKRLISTNCTSLDRAR